MTTPSTSAGFRDEILKRMDERNDKMRPYERMFESYGHLAEALRKAKTGRPRTQSQSTALEMRPEMAEEYQKMKDELAEIHKKMNMNAMEYMDAQRTVREIKDKLLKVTEERDALKGGQQKFKTRIAELEQALKKATEDMNLVRDEKVSLSLAHMKQTETIQRLEMEQIHFINCVRDLQEKLATVMNAEVEQQTARQQATVAALIASALTDTSRDERANSLLSQNDYQTGQVNYGDILPTHAQFKFEASDSELLDVCWLNTDQFATAGQDKKIRIWRVDASGRQSKISTLTGFNNAVTRLDYDSESKYLLASSNDSSVRVFNVDNQRLLTTLRSHTEKVIVAKFHSTLHAVSGGNDRSIKLWDLRAERCVKSYFPGSTIHDLIGRVSFGGNAWISGHFDKKVRVYDGRAEQPVQTLEMAGKVTSLDIATDGHSILCSTRDDTLSLLDIRNLGTLHIYSAEQYRTSSDFSRCIISPGMYYVAAGSSDGQVYVWNLNSTKLEKVLGRGGHEHPALAVRWNPCGRGLLSCDKLKHVVYWT